MKKKKDQGSDYEVGYGKPPKHTRFQTGQSGNLGGRPVKRHIPSLWKQLDPLNSAILEQAARLLDIRTTEGKKTISQLEAALEKLFKMGMQGNRPSLVTFIELIQKSLGFSTARTLKLATSFRTERLSGLYLMVDSLKIDCRFFGYWL